MTHTLKSNDGRGLYTVSIEGKEAPPGILASSAPKAAIIGIAGVQGKESAGTAITVSEPAPAVIRTAIHDNMPDAQIAYIPKKSDEEIRDHNGVGGWFFLHPPRSHDG